MYSRIQWCWSQTVAGLSLIKSPSTSAKNISQYGVSRTCFQVSNNTICNTDAIIVVIVHNNNKVHVIASF